MVKKGLINKTPYKLYGGQSIIIAQLLCFESLILLKHSLQILRSGSEPKYKKIEHDTILQGLAGAGISISQVGKPRPGS